MRGPLTLIVTLHHFDLLLVIGSAEKLPLFEDKLIAFLQSRTANNAYETPEVKYTLLASPHYQFFRSDCEPTGQTFVSIYSEEVNDVRFG